MRAEFRKGIGRATLNDIAKHAGVSVSTASAVLADKAKERRISQDVADRVRTAATQMDYAPNLLVRSLQRGKTHVLSFFNGFRARNENDLYMERLMTALERSAGRLGYDILVSCDFRRSAQETYRYLNGGRSDGLILFAPPSDDPLLPYLRTSRLPTVLVSREDSANVLPSVKGDTENGLRQVADRLIALGHRRIAIIGHVPDGNQEAAVRVALVREILANHGVIVPDRWILPASDQPADDAAEALRFLMAETTPPTALFCWHDRIGYQILAQCEIQGISVPDQLSVIGYDGLFWPASTRHTLASVSLDLVALADASVDILVRQIQRGEDVLSPRVTVLPVTLTKGTTLGSHEQRRDAFGNDCAIRAIT